MIEVEDLFKSYGRHVALTGVSFQVPSGSIAGFLGPNGAGKTTCMRILTTFFPADRGIARVAGFDTASQPEEVCARVGYLPESFPLYPELRVDEYLRYRAVLKGIPRKQVRERVSAVLGECALEEVSRKLLIALSKGYRQRVGLADALLADPEVLILDEPTSGLDPRQVRDVRSLIGSMRNRRTVLLSSHILGEVEQVCDQVIILDRGTIQAVESRDSWTERLRDANRLTLVLEDPPSDVVTRLRALEGVIEVEASESGRFELRTRGDRRRALVEHAADSGWKLLEIHSREATLESLFLEVTGEGKVAS